MKRFLLIHLILLVTGLFHSLPAQNFKFAVMSDSRGRYTGVNEPVLSALAEHLSGNHPDIKFLVFPGDMVDGSKSNPAQTIKELKHWKSVMKPVYDLPGLTGPKIYTTPGNHEIQHRNDENNFRTIFNDMPQNGPEDERGLTYSFDYDKVHFTVINSDRWYYGDPEDTTDDRRDWHYIKHLDWVENDLKTARENGAEWLIVISHEVAFPTGGHLRDGLPNLGMKLSLPLDSARQSNLNHFKKFWNILDKYDAAAYICGHEHSYTRQSVNDIYQIVAGSSGAPVYYFNPTFDEGRDTVISGMEMLYEDSVPYYEALGYNYGPGKNSQASDDFVGIRAFHYVILNISNDLITVETYGMPVSKDNLSIPEGSISLIDKFEIKKTSN